MKTAPKGDYKGNFWDWNFDISGSKGAMNAFESALESWDSVLFNAIIFRTIEYSDLNLQMKISSMSIYEKTRKNTKLRIQSEIRRVNLLHFFLKEVYDDTFRKEKIWNPQMTLYRNFHGQIVKIQKSENAKWQKLVIL